MILFVSFPPILTISHSDDSKPRLLKRETAADDTLHILVKGISYRAESE